MQLLKVDRTTQFILLDCTDEKEYQKYLKNVAITDDIGDELVARCSRDELSEKIETFQQKCAEWNGKYSQGLSVSIGYAFNNENPSLDIFAPLF